MDLSSLGRLFSGLTLLTVPTIAFGGHFLLRVLGGRHAALNPLQKSLMRAGHAHAGVLVLLGLLGQLFTDALPVAGALEWAMRVSFVLAALLVSGGFFAAAAGQQPTQPHRVGLWVLYAGVAALVFGTLALGIGLVRSA